VTETFSAGEQISGGAGPADMAVFVRVVERRGFSAAAKTLGLTPSAVSKIVSRLEARLGVRLLARTTRRLSLTPEGEAYLARSRRILDEIAEAEAEIAGFRARPRGLLRINCGVSFGQHQLVPALPDFLARYPEIGLEVVLLDRVINLAEEGADLAIRMGPVVDTALVARKICDLERIVCAAPAYLERHGTPRRPADLLSHNCLNVWGFPNLAHWHFDTRDGPVTVEVSGTVAANNAESLLMLALDGVGIVRLTDIIVGGPIRAGRLIPLLADCRRAEPVPLHAVYPQNRHRTPKLTAMLDFLVERFAGRPWRAEAPKARRRQDALRSRAAFTSGT